MRLKIDDKYCMVHGCATRKIYSYLPFILSCTPSNCSSRTNSLGYGCCSPSFTTNFIINCSKDNTYSIEFVFKHMKCTYCVVLCFHHRFDRMFLHLCSENNLKLKNCIPKLADFKMVKHFYRPGQFTLLSNEWIFTLWNLFESQDLK